MRSKFGIINQIAHLLAAALLGSGMALSQEPEDLDQWRTEFDDLFGRSSHLLGNTEAEEVIDPLDEPYWDEKEDHIAVMKHGGMVGLAQSVAGALMLSGLDLASPKKYRLGDEPPFTAQEAFDTSSQASETILEVVEKLKKNAYGLSAAANRQFASALGKLDGPHMAKPNPKRDADIVALRKFFRSTTKSPTEKAFYKDAYRAVSNLVHSGVRSAVIVILEVKDEQKKARAKLYLRGCGYDLK